METERLTGKKRPITEVYETLLPNVRTTMTERFENQMKFAEALLEWEQKNDVDDRVRIFKKYYYECSDLDMAFETLCGHGELELAQLFVLVHRGLDTNAFDSCAFRAACRGGHIKVAKWLFSRGGVRINADDDHAFRYACRNGHLDMAKWLFSLGNVMENLWASPSKVDVHADEDFAFRWACANGHLDVAKWLLSLGDVDVHNRNDLTLFLACKNGMFDVVQWLMLNFTYTVQEHVEDAFQVACLKGHEKITTLFTGRGCSEMRSVDELNLIGDLSFQASCLSGELNVETIMAKQLGLDTNALKKETIKKEE